MGEDRVESIRRSVESGTLSKEDAAQQLQAIIDRELSGPLAKDADMALVTRCQNLLWEWKTDGLPYENREAESCRQLDRKMRSRQAKRKYTLRIVLAGLMVALLAVMNMTSITRLEWGHTPDGEQVVVTGREQYLSLGGRGVADDDDGMCIENHSTTSLEDAIAFMGFDPGFPEEMPGGYRLRWYDMSQTPEWWSCSGVYTKDNLYLNATVFHVLNWNDFRMTYEQNEPGEFVDIDGIRVYMACNYDQRLLMFSRGDYLYTVTGLFSQTDDAAIVRSLTKGAENL